MPKQINGVDIGTFRKVLDAVHMFCPSEFKLGEYFECDSGDCFDCWMQIIDREATANAETETSQTT